MIYDAFISYRHTPLDMEFAKKVHTGLETYRVPKSVQKKTGKKKIKRVFRDQEELPIGSDLNDNISSALRESEFLIVICSPETPGSYWVSKEIETFIAMHDRQHILAVLVDGEPDQSFPPLLLTDENGHPVEPLAADVRGSTPKERNRRFKTELLRLAAPVLGCTYDDLRQRHRERIVRRNLLIAAAAAGIIAVAGTVFGIYNAGVAKRMKKLADSNAKLADEKTLLAGEKSRLADEKTKLADEKTKLADEILAEFREKQENQSRFYAEEAMILLGDGNREDAVLVASAGLPSADNDRPYVPESEYALAAALHAYDCGNELSYDRILSHDLNIRYMNTTDDARYLVSVDSGDTVYVWDTETWELLLKLAPVIEENYSIARPIAVCATRTEVIVTYRNAIVRYDYTGTETGRFSFDVTVSTCVIFEERGLAACLGMEKQYLISIPDFNVIREILPGDLGRSGTDCCLSKDGRLFASGIVTGDEENACVLVTDLTSDGSVSFAVSEQYILNLAFTDEGNLAAVSTNTDFYYDGGMNALTLDVFNPATGEKLFSDPLPLNVRSSSEFVMLIEANTYEEKSCIVIAIDGDMYTFDAQSGELFTHIALPGNAISLSITQGKSTAFIGLQSGEIVAVDTVNGRFYSSSVVSTKADMQDMKVLYGGIVFRCKSSGIVYVMKYHQAPGIQELPELEEDSIGLAVAPSSEYYVLAARHHYGSFGFYDRDGKELFLLEGDDYPIAVGFSGNTCVMAFFSQMKLIDPLQGTSSFLRYTDLGLAETYTGASVSPDGNYLSLWGSFGVVLFDLTKKECVLKKDISASSGYAALSGDGRKLLVARPGEPVTLIDTETGDITEWDNDSLRQVSDNSRLKYLKCDESGQYVAMACSDGFVRILSAASGRTVLTIPLQVRSVCFLGFTKDSTHIILQGDDYVVRIYRISDGVCRNSFDAPAPVAYMIEDGDFIALCDNYTVSLLSSDTFGRRAFVPDGVTYLASSKTFILVDGKEAWTTQYKDYRELLREAERQFPGAELSAEKRVAYNLESGS